MVKKSKGKFIVIDGTDGSGKATQTELLVKALKKQGTKVFVADFPQYKKKSSGAVVEYLNGKYGQVNPYAASVFYAVDRFDASFSIRKALENGAVVISNRYVTANAGHQGGKIHNKAERNKYFKWLENLEYNIFGIPKPDLNIILHVPAKVAQKLVDAKSSAARSYATGKNKKRDLHEKDLQHLLNAEETYVQIAKTFPKTKLVECVAKGELLSREDVHAKILQTVERMITHRT